MTKLMKSQLLLAGLLLLTSCGRIGDVLDGLLLPEADAQTYVRPSKGRAITAVSTTVMTSSTPAVSTTYDMSSFAALQVVVTVENGNDDCAYVPVISVPGVGALPGDGTTLYDPNAYVEWGWATVNMTAPVTLVYVINNLPPFITLNVTTQAGGGAESCSVSVVVVPLPYIVATPENVNRRSGNRALTTTAGRLIPVGDARIWTARHLTVQNIGTVPALCGFTINGTDVDNGGIYLAGGTVANDGTGGSITLEGIGTGLFCETDSGTTDLRWLAY